MRVGASSAVFYPMVSERALDELIEIGFKQIEYFFNCDEEISPSYVRKIMEKIDSAGAHIISVHPFTAFAESVYFFSEYGRRTEESIRKYKNYFGRASEIGAKFFTFHGERNIEGFSYDDSKCIPSESSLESLARLADAAKEYGITLCLENVSWCKSANVYYLKKVAEQLGEKIGFTLDLKQALRVNAPVRDYINVMGSRIKNIHVSDHDAENMCMLPGAGDFNFRGFFDDVGRVGYNGDIIIEVYSNNYKNKSEIKESKRYLEQIIFQN